VALPEDDNHHSHRRGNLKSYTVHLLSHAYPLVQYAFIELLPSNRPFHLAPLFHPFSCHVTVLSLSSALKAFTLPCFLMFQNAVF
jgi:hypothetical protein